VVKSDVEDIFELFEEECSGNGQLIDDDCDCNTGYVGAECPEYECFGILNNDTEVCSGNGYCWGNNTCTCMNGYEGIECESIKTDNLETPFSITESYTEYDFKLMIPENEKYFVTFNSNDDEQIDPLKQFYSFNKQTNEWNLKIQYDSIFELF
jgi:hypothetical protein